MPRAVRPVPDTDEVANRRPRSRSSPGVSGAGRSEAAHSLEDLGYFVVDNLPPALLPKMAELASRPGGPARVAIVVDARGGVFFGELSKALEELDAAACGVPDPLPGGGRRRPREPVRGHATPPPARAGRPRGRGHPQGAADDGEPARRRGPHHRHLGPHAARAPRPDPRGVRRRAARAGPPGLADLVRIQVRGAARRGPRPRRPVPAEPPLGRRAPAAARHRRARICTTSRGSRSTESSWSGSRALLDVIVPGYVAEGKSYLTIAVGCTGGRHRSVVVAEELARYFRSAGRRSPSTTATSTVAMSAERPFRPATTSRSDLWPAG